MNGSMRTNSDYLGEMTQMLDCFRDVLETENNAIYRRDTATLRALSEDKADTGKQIETLWREFRPRLAIANDSDRDAFLELNKRLVELQPLIVQNMKLLTAAKISTANRIESGISAWRRSQADQSVNYLGDGSTSSPGDFIGTKPVRLS